MTCAVFLNKEVFARFKFIVFVRILHNTPRLIQYILDSSFKRPALTKSFRESYIEDITRHFIQIRICFKTYRDDTTANDVIKDIELEVFFCIVIVDTYVYNLRGLALKWAVI